MSTAARISIAICTFNGERFLQQQLDSLLKQSRRPDEVLACDDGSTDRTIELLETFARTAPFLVRIQRNATRLGPAQNFAAAIAGCTGEIISLCDQDDIWEPEKLAVAEAAFSQNPRPAFVFSDADMCDQDGRSLGYRLWNSVGFTRPMQDKFKSGHALQVLVRQNIVTGATLSFDARYRSLVLPIAGTWMHDGWIALLLSAAADAVAIEQPLIRYRQHAGQSVGAARRSFYQQYQNAKKMDRAVFANLADQYEAALARLQETSDFDVSPKVVDLLQEKIRHCRRRSAIRQGEIGRFFPSVVELLTLRYQRFSLGWKSFLQDLFL